MKWGGYSEKAAEKITKKIMEIVGVKGVYILVSLAAFALLVGATQKWRP